MLKEICPIKTVLNPKEILNAMNKIKASFPYNKKEFLKNDVLVKARKEELNNEIEMSRKVYLNLENILKEIREK